MFRPEVVLSWKDGSNHLFYGLSRISGPLSCPRAAYPKEPAVLCAGTGRADVTGPAVDFLPRPDTTSSSLGSSIVILSGRLRRLPSPIQQRSSQHEVARRAPQPP